AAAALTLGGCAMKERRPMNADAVVGDADLILFNGSVATMDPARPRASALAIRDGKVLIVGSDTDVLKLKGIASAIDVGGRCVIPGLNDSHLHVIRGGLTYNLELRWDGVPSLADAMRLLREQVSRTPQGQWVRGVGGFAGPPLAGRRVTHRTS